MTYHGEMEMKRNVDQDLKVSEGVKQNRQEEESQITSWPLTSVLLWLKPLWVPFWKGSNPGQNFELSLEGQLLWLILNSWRVSGPPAAVGSKAVLFSTFHTVIFPSLSPSSFPIFSCLFHSRCLLVGTIQAALLAWSLLATILLLSQLAV